MQITILQENLAPVLQTLKRFLASKPQLPILSCVLFQAEQGAIYISATDLFMGARIQVSGTVEEVGSAAIPARTLSEIVASLQPGKITLNSAQNTVTIMAAKNTTQLQIFDAEEYPPFPEPGTTTLTLSTELLDQVQDSIAFAVSKDETRPLLSTVLFKLGEETHLVATDGFRLAFRKTSLPGINATLLFPAKALSEVVKLAHQSKTTDVRLAVSEELQQVYCQIGDTQLYVRLLEGEFPPYQKILPTQFAGQVVIASDELDQLLKTASIFARESSRIIVFEVGEEVLTISATSPALGTHTGTMPLKRLSGESIKIAFNVGYVMDMVAKAAGKNLILSHNNNLDPVVLSPEGDEDFMYVIMPFKLQQD